MDEQVNRLVEKVWTSFQTLDPSKRLLIAISGIPGSGKTTIAKTVALRLNSLLPPNATPVAADVPMDGYHLSRAQLSAMPDPTHAHARRGAEFTFDGSSFLDLVRRVRIPLTPSSQQTLYAPSFSHAIKDPVENDIPIPPSTRIILFEGNYLSLNKEPWKEAASLMDELWFMDVDFEVAGSRLVERHLESGVAADRESAWKRVRENDLINGREIVENRLEVEELVRSVKDENFGKG